MINDTNSPLSLIRQLQSTLSASFSERSSPAFDPQVLHSIHQFPVLHEAFIQQISSWGLPRDISGQISTLLGDESSRCQVLVRHTRAEILGQLIKTSVAPDPSVIPSLVESMCNAVYQSAIDKMLSDVQKEIEAFAFCNDIESDNGSDSASATEDEAGEEEEEDEEDDDDDGDDDGNGPIDGLECEEEDIPMKPGEEIPPLETKYLPIFEALHERGKVLTKPEKTYLVNMTGMTYRQITIWFQNRRRGELKESTNQITSYPRTSSIHSDESSELSEQELEKSLGSYPSNVTFDIRSWRLQSALVTKNDNCASTSSFSPLKSNFSFAINTSDTDSDCSELSDDTDGEIPVSPGLQASSLAASMTSVNSANATGTSANDLVTRTQPVMKSTISGSKGAAHSRPIKSLPPSKRSALSSLPQQRECQPSQSLSVKPSSPQYQSNHTGDATHSSSQIISSSESGLIINLEAVTQLQADTLTSSLIHIPLAPINDIVPGPSGPSPSPTPTSTRSPQSHPSPTPSISPRPNPKPLSRRTGCAPRPRPPLRSGPPIPNPSPVTVPSSSRPSVILPPSSNPSLGNTTLGALLRPNPTAPAIPQDIQERLTAMAERMGVGSSTRHEISSCTPQVSGTLGGSVFSNRNVRFSFGPTSLPGTGVSLGKNCTIKQAIQNSSSLPPS